MLTCIQNNWKQYFDELVYKVYNSQLFVIPAFAGMDNFQVIV